MADRLPHVRWLRWQSPLRYRPSRSHRWCRCSRSCRPSCCLSGTALIHHARYTAGCIDRHPHHTAARQACRHLSPVRRGAGRFYAQGTDGLLLRVCSFPRFFQRYQPRFPAFFYALHRAVRWPLPCAVLTPSPRQACTHARALPAMSALCLPASNRNALLLCHHQRRHTILSYRLHLYLLSLCASGGFCRPSRYDRAHRGQR